MSPALEKVAILDCGAQYTKVIDRRIRELNVDSHILPLSVPARELAGFQAVILSGGPNSVFAEDAPAFDPAILNLGLPVLGICYGMQLMAHHLGGLVEPGTIREFGETEISVQQDLPLFHDLASSQHVLMSHGDRVVRLPDGFIEAGRSSDGILAAMANPARRLYGLQFHPEVELTVHGAEMIRNFLYEVAGLKGTYQLDLRLEDTLDRIREQVGANNVFVLVSGGVDSAVTAALLLKALGPEPVYALHMDTGFMRHQESDTVCDALRQLGLKHLNHLKVGDVFLNATTELDGVIVGPLHTVTDPEVKRRIIGDTFFKLTQEAILGMNLDLNRTFIAQGTLRPDLIESGNLGVSQIAHKIKTHHNDVPLIQAQREKGLIIEPNRDWHKDEVRQVGRMLGLPEDVVSRQPFPGPGLAIRMLCADEPYLTPEFSELNQAVHTAAQRIGLHGTVLPVKSVGVQGDYRSYSFLAALSGPYSEDWNTLKQLATHLPNNHPAINRVVLSLVPEQPPLPAEIREITPTRLSSQTLDLLRQIDYDVTQAFFQAGLGNSISQLLSVLVPVDSQRAGRHSIAIRAVITSDYMTARPARLGDEIPWSLIQPLAEHLVQRYPLDRIFYDLTSKPPATVEWE